MDKCIGLRQRRQRGAREKLCRANSEPLALAKADHEKAAWAIAAARLTVTTEGAKAFELYANLLSDKA